MFGVDFSELMVIMVVALIVIGPERLPKVARMMGNLWGRMQRYVNDVKKDIANDIAIQEANKLRGSIREEINAIEQSAHEARVALEQKILQAQLGIPHDAADEQAPPVKQPSTTTGKQV